jgi:hypothetical protein
MAFDVFLCHNSSDKEAVERVGQQLRDAGLAPWLDVWEIEAGQRWRVELERQLGTIPCAAVFVAADGIGPWQDREVDVILDEMVRRDGRVIPVLLPGCPVKPELPLLLRSFHWVDFRGDEQEAILSLVRGILGSKRVAPAAIGKRGGFPLNNLRIPSLGGLFTGREAQLSVVVSQLAAGGAGAQVLSGLGGVGKTRLAVEYAWRHAERYTAIFFVGADGEADLRRNFAVLAGRTLLDLKLPPDAAEDVAITEVVVALRNRPGWLLILDNVDTIEAQLALRTILPLEGGRVLITSRLQQWPTGTCRLEVERLDPEAARDYLLKATDGRSIRPGEEAAATTLAEKLGFLPLALELTAAYIRANGLTFAEILAGWATEEQKVVVWHDPGATEYPRSLALTWERSFDRLASSSKSLLHFLAHLAPEPIPEGLVEAGSELLAGAADGNFDVRAALAELQRYSLIGREIRGEARFLSLHSLVQAVALDRIPFDDRAAWAELAVQVLLEFLPEHPPDDILSWPVWDPSQQPGGAAPGDKPPGGGRAADAACARDRRSGPGTKPSERCDSPQQPGAAAPGDEPPGGGRVADAAFAGDGRARSGFGPPIDRHGTKQSREAVAGDRHGFRPKRGRRQCFAATRRGPGAIAWNAARAAGIPAEIRAGGGPPWPPCRGRARGPPLHQGPASPVYMPEGRQRPPSFSGPVYRPRIGPEISRAPLATCESPLRFLGLDLPAAKRV